MANIPRSHWAHYTIPRSARPHTVDEKIFFVIPEDMNAANYKVLIEDLSGVWKSLGTLRDEVILPNVHFPARAKILVVGKNSKGEDVKLVGDFVRRSHYVLHNIAGTHVIRPGVYV